MDMIISFLLAIASSMLIDNVILTKFYGICPFLGVSKKTKSAWWMGISVLFVTVIASLITWPIHNYILVPANIEFMDIIVYILVIASLVQFIEILLKKCFVRLHNLLGIYLPLITTNCAILGVVKNNVDAGYTFGQAMANAIGTGLGFTLIIYVFSCIRIKLDSANVPKAFKGIPIALITAAIMSLAFFGLRGLIG